MKGPPKKLIPIAMAVWIGITCTFLFWMEKDTRRNEKLLAQSAANAFFQQIVISRQWNASHGGVYVPITATTQPNEYLPAKGRDLTADNGLKLTKVNPSYMTRQIAELAQKNESGIQFHITSLKPIRPENKATEWEERWLNSFEQGVKEQGEFFEDGNTTWFRYMAPLLTGPECLKCHAQQGYKEGDIRGGLSLSLPYPAHTHLRLFIGFAAVAVIGLIFIFLGATFYRRKQRLFEATFNSPVPTSVTDTNHTILMANESYWAEFGALPPGRPKKIKCYEHRPGPSCHTENCPLSRIMAGASQYTYETVKEFAGEPRHFIVTAKPLLDARDKVIGSVESFQEITKRKQAEKALEESNRTLEALSITDGLTGIANRRHFDAVLTKEHARHARSGADLSLILLDIDLFKSFNDCYGHVDGDECLRKVAKVMADCVARPADLVARYGGEEFVCILPETDSSGAVAIAENIRRGIIALAIPHTGSSVAAYVTASLGVATVQCTEGGSVVEIVAQVDAQLYRAKAAGRNRVKFVASRNAGANKDTLVRLAWKDSFCCGNHLIDSQHQSLFHLSNELLEAVLSARPAAEISAIISRLLAEVNQHFHDEEKVLETVDFPGRSQHVAEHAKLLARGLELAEEFKSSTLTVGDVFQFLASEVIMLHMLEADREYFPFINEAGAADSETGNGT